MSIRRRVWASGTHWVHDYRDGSGKRRVQSYATLVEAEAAAAKIAVALDAIDADERDEMAAAELAMVVVVE
jgi:hypothetical protein